MEKGTYSSWQRVMNSVSIILFIAFMILLAYQIVTQGRVSDWWLVIPVFFLGMFLADFVSGLVHWSADTWGSVTWLIVGPFLRSFREHHRDPQSIVRHDVIQRDGDNCLIGLPVLIATYFSTVPIIMKVLSLIFLVAIALTNEIHAAAHAKKRGNILSFLQKKCFILKPKNHNIHHTSPFATYYCITTGWLNPFLARIQFFPRLERLVTVTTGAIPRAEDRKLGRIKKG